MSQGSSDHFWKSLWDDGELPHDARTLRGFLHDNVEKNLQYAMELYHEIGQGSRGWGAPWDQDVRNKGDSNERPPTWQSLFSADQNEENKSAGKILPKRIPDKNPMEFFKEVLRIHLVILAPSREMFNSSQTLKNNIREKHVPRRH